jgi:hypothetical protein
MGKMDSLLIECASYEHQYIDSTYGSNQENAFCSLCFSQNHLSTLLKRKTHLTPMNGEFLITLCILNCALDMSSFLLQNVQEKIL